MKPISKLRLTIIAFILISSLFALAGVCAEPATQSYDSERRTLTAGNKEAWGRISAGYKQGNPWTAEPVGTQVRTVASSNIQAAQAAGVKLAQAETQQAIGRTVELMNTPGMKLSAVYGATPTNNPLFAMRFNASTGNWDISVWNPEQRGWAALGANNKLPLPTDVVVANSFEGADGTVHDIAERYLTEAVNLRMYSPHVIVQRSSPASNTAAPAPALTPQGSRPSGQSAPTANLPTGAPGTKPPTEAPGAGSPAAKPPITNSPEGAPGAKPAAEIPKVTPVETQKIDKPLTSTELKQIRQTAIDKYETKQATNVVSRLFWKNYQSVVEINGVTYEYRLHRDTLCKILGSDPYFVYYRRFGVTDNRAWRSTNLSDE